MYAGGKGRHPEGFDRLERWGSVNIIVFNRSKCKVLHWVGEIPSTNTDWEENRLSILLCGGLRIVGGWEP